MNFELYQSSSAQKRLFMLRELMGETTVYNLPYALLMEGQISFEKIESIFHRLIQRHEALRTGFELIDGEVLQKVYVELPFFISYRASERKDIDEMITEFIQPFNLTEPPLLRVEVVRFDEGKHLLLFDIDHIVTDGQSNLILVKEFIDLYQGKELPEIEVQYVDFAIWQNQLIDSSEIKEQEDYWLGVFAEATQPLNLPTDFARPEKMEYVGDHFFFEITPELTKKIKELTTKAEVTPFMFFFSLYNILLARLADQDDLVVGIPVAGRSSHELMNTVGMFVNTLAMRNYSTSDKEFITFLKEVKFNTLAGFANQDYQFEMLVDQLNLPRYLNRNPLFDTMFLYQNTSVSEVEFEDVTFIPYKYQSRVARFDLLFTVLQEEDSYTFDIEFNTELFTMATAKRLASCFQSILNQFLSDPELRLGELEILTNEEREVLVTHFNGDQVCYEESGTVHELFEIQVKKNPNQVALIFDDQKLTYGQLNGSANHLARILRERGVGPDQIVGIMSEPSLEMIIGILGILKAGGAYLPIDPNYPGERVSYMVEDSGIQVLLTSLSEVERPDFEFIGQLIDLFDISYDQTTPNLPVNTDLSNLVYLIYTSGSTGKPKGAMLEHGNLVNLLNFQLNRTNIDTSGRVLQFTTISFDVSFQEIFSTLLAGGELYLNRKEIKDNLSLLLEFIQEKEIRTLFMPVAFLRLLFSESGYIANISETVKHIVTAGEQLIIDERIREYLQAKGVYLHNHYGPSETHVVTTLTIDPTHEIAEIPTIGKPIDNTQIYIVSNEGQLQPIGVPGELWIGGANVGRGYYHRQDLTKEKFIENPFGSGKVYRTGDLVKWRADGELEFLGRIDHQVKIRGFRIELGEIEAQLLENQSIKAGVVVAKEDQDGSKYLVAYYEGSADLIEAELKGFLAERLPEYMVPAYMIQVDQLPLTPSGKVDRKRLPDLEFTQRNANEYQAPTNEFEAQLVQIWSDLLKIERIGIEDDFFDLGGHSLKATALVAKIYKEMDVNLSLRQVFKTPTIKGLAAEIKGQQKSIYQSIEPIEEREYYPVSSAQKRLFLLDQIEGMNTVYNMPAAFIVKGRLDIEKLKRVFSQLIQRHEALRTSFAFVEGEPVQKVNKVVDFNLEYQELENESIDGKTKINVLVREFVRPFDLNQAPLLRVGLIKIGSDQHILMFDMHHIISDGTTLTILTKELVEFYNDHELLPLKIQYKDFANWQNQLLNSPMIISQEEYWVERFTGEIPALNLSTDFPRPKKMNYQGDRMEFYLSKELTEKVKQFCKDENVTLFMLLLASYNTLLFKYTGQEDLIIGSPIAGREHPDLENIIGIFVNTLAMRNYPTGRKAFIDFLKEVRENSLKAYENQDYQFEMLVDRLNLKRSLNRNPLFDAMFVLLNMELPSIITEDLEFTPASLENLTAKFDLLLQGTMLKEDIQFSLEYNSELFATSAIQRMTEHFVNILESVLTNPQLSLAEIEMISTDEKKRVVEVFNNTSAIDPEGKNITQLFEIQVKKNPNQVALIFDDQKLTYGQLNGSANHLARILRERGVGPDQIVGIMSEPSLEMIIGILGILKAGGAYLPIDLNYPSERVGYMVEDSGIQVLLTSLSEVERPDFEFIGQLIDLSDISYDQTTPNLSVNTDLSNLVYLIYTSGSTGKPKGAMLEHGNLVNLLNFQLNRTNIDTSGRVLQFTTISFDVSFQEIFSTLLAGGELYLIRKEIKDNLSLLLEFIQEKEIRTLFMPVAFLRLLFSESGYIANISETVKHIVTAGEQLIVDERIRDFLQAKGVYLHNHYGPSETHVVTTLTIDPTHEIAEIPTIGKPIDNTQIYIVSKEGQLQPIGVPGELWIGGANVGRGYYHRQDLTKEKFIENPFGSGKVYRTGDLVKWRADGELEFLGRLDHQVKIRGFRIELGEIEAQILENQSIKAGVVVAKEDQDGSKYLVAYYEGSADLIEAELKGFLAERLPEYMVPAFLIQVDQLPLTPSGKVDRKRLPDFEFTQRNANEYQAPTNEFEAQLIQIWSELLKVERIGIEDDFFDLGGHSLKATALIAKIYKEMDINLSLRQVFKTPTIKGLAAEIKGQQKSIYQRIEPVVERDYYPLSSAQKRLFLLNQMEEMSTTYNIPGLLSIKGNLDLEQVHSAIVKLIDRHQALRTSFEYIIGEPVQKVNRKVDFRVEFKDLSNKEDHREVTLTDEVNAFVRPFDLSSAPLLRVGLVKVLDDEYLLIFDMHHIISDGTSLTILVREFTQLYAGQELTPLRIQYKDFALWQNELFKSEMMTEQEQYWIDKFNDEIPLLNLPTDYSRSGVKSFAGSAVGFSIPQELTEKLKALARNGGATLYMVLMAAYNLLLSKYSGEEDIIIGSPIAGRPHPDLENMIGMFVNTLAVRNYPKGDLSFEQFLINVKESLLKDFDHQDYQFEMLVERLNLRRDLSRNPLFDVMLILQNHENPEFLVPDLKILPESMETTVSKFDLTLNMYEKDDELICQMEYCTDLFKEETVLRMIRHLIQIFKVVVQEPTISLDNIDILTAEERETLLVAFNHQAAGGFSSDQTVHQLFEEQVVRNPKRIALVFSGMEISYHELNQRANSLAHILRQKGVKPDQIVAILAHQSIERVIAMLAILKAGGAYLPIDPDYPIERIEYLLKDSECKLVLTDDKSYQPDPLEIVDLTDQSCYSEDKRNLKIVNQPEDLAYVIYTSGTTGKPKGVMVEHRGVVNLIEWFGNQYDLTKYNRILQLTNYTFDPSVEQIFGGLTKGATLYLVAKDLLLNKDRFISYLEENQIQMADFVPAVLKEIILDHEKISSLDILISGGERLENTLKDQLLTKGYRLFNHYGPTEVTVQALISECDGGDVKIGRPITNLSCYVLDKNLKPVPIGVAGELCISGMGLARGYLNRPEMTGEKFVDNPFEIGERLYRTGDLVRWLTNGMIEFLGRIDDQIKIRGFRVEPAEIERTILEDAQVTGVVVIARCDEKENNRHLWAYLVSDSSFDLDKLKKDLADQLPNYMIPTNFVRLDQMPLTANSKIDRKVLESLDEHVIVHEYLAPTNELEEKLAEIWSGILKVEQVGINDNFFELGGHSLKAASLISQVYKELQANLTLQDIFTTPTIRSLAEKIEGLEKEVYLEIEPIEERDYYPVSSAQRRLYLLDQLEGLNTTYNMPGVVMIEGDLDQIRLELAFNQLIDRHESLRTSFEMVNGEPVQKVLQQVEFAITIQEQEGVGEDSLNQIIQGFVGPFDLSKAPLIRVCLLAVEKEKNLLIFDMHHIISDGKSMDILLSELFSLYQGEELVPLKIQYRDFAYWQNQYLTSEEIEKEENYWLELFADEIPVLNLPTDYPRPTVMTYEGDQFNFTLDQDLTKKLRSLAKEKDVTMYMLLLAAYNLLLSRYAGQEDIVVGSPIAGRNHVDLENLIGIFVNTLALRNKPENDLTFTQFLAQVKEGALKAFDYQNYQFEMLVDKLDLNRDLSRNPLFDTMFVMQNAGDLQKRLRGYLDSGLKVSPYQFENRVAKFDLTLSAMEGEEEIICNLEYRVDLFKRETMESMANHLVNLISELVVNPEVKLGQMEMISAEEKERILLDFNQTQAEFPTDQTLHQLFEEQVAKRPDQIAVLYKEEYMTYGELNQRANQLARVLRRKGVKSEMIVGIMVKRSLDLIIGVLGILKAGGAYLPIDPMYPDDRIEYILEDSKMELLLTEGVYIDNLNFTGEMVSLTDEKLFEEDSSNLAQVNQPHDLAYIIYTSGSTGKPKGVMIEHRNVVRLLFNDQFQFDFNENDIWTMFHSPCFDFSVWEMYGALLYGGKLVIIPKLTAQDPGEFLKLLKKEEVTVLNQTPTAFYNLSDIEVELVEKELKLRYVIFGGEALKPAMLKLWKEKYPKTRLINMYGITETTVHVTFKEITNHDIEKAISNIGKPIPTLKIYIMDQNTNLVPIGVPGELCVGGAGVARGYLNRAELTGEKFISNPYNAEERLYRSGDLARFLPDGNIEYLGRIDRQVKIRGFRIELGEIENQLLRYSSIQNTVVIDKKDAKGDKYLTAYIVPVKSDKEGENDELSISELRTYLEDQLPDYMIPSYFIRLKEMRLTANGKIDLKALPEPDGFRETKTAYVAPRNKIEEKLVAICSEILSVSEVGIYDNFFDLGGHSLKATALVSKVLQELNVELPLGQVFKTPTIMGLAVYIQLAEEGTCGWKYAQDIQVIEEREYYPVSSAQKRLFVLNQLEGNNTSYNIPGAMIIEGELDPERLEMAFKKLIDRQDSLRTSFFLIEGEPVQKIQKDVEFHLNYMDLDCDLKGNKDEIKILTKGFIKPFDLSKAPLLRVGLLKAECKYLLVFDMHHIISDGVSMEILKNELIQLYQGNELPELKIQFKDFSAWQNKLFSSDALKKQEEYWVNQFATEIPTLDLPTDYSTITTTDDARRQALLSLEGDRIKFKIEEEITVKINDLVKEHDATLYMVLLTAFNILLSKYTSQEDIIIGSPIAGRPKVELGNIIGMFVNTLAIRNFPKGHISFQDFLEEVKERTLKAFENQDYQFDMLVEKLDLERDLSRNPLFDVMFVLQNMNHSPIEVDGLKFIPYEVENKTVKFDLLLSAAEVNDKICFDLEYSTRLFKREMIERMAKHFVNIMKISTDNPRLSISEIEILSGEEKHQLLIDFNNTKADYSKDKTIHQLFEEQVERTPEKIAAIFENKKLTFRELNAKANQLARFLREKGIEPNQIVGIMVERSFEMITGIFGILKAGGAYLPIDPEYPQERIRYMLADSGAKILLTMEHLTDRVHFTGELINLNKISENITEDVSNLEIINKPNDLVYVIYTSGSTGQPKGVMLEHRSIINRLHWMQRFYPINSSDTILQKTIFTFDVSVWEIFWWSIVGAKVAFLEPGGEKEPSAIVKAVKKYQVTTMHFVPSMLTAFLEYIKDLPDLSELSTLKQVFASGEALTVKQVETFNQYLKKENQTRLHNLYGPTEASIDVSYFECSDLTGYNTVPIGKPIDNIQLYILDQENRVQPIGVAGELHIAGVGLARGYLNRPELTGEKFVPNPFNLGERMYKTGDLTRWLADGNIEFLGRIDHQVKIRGFRLELGEIEAQLISYPKIREVVVIDREDRTGDKYLCCYFTSEKDVTIAELREYLGESLPHYMIPSYFMQLEKLPLTSNGKVNRKGLPEPEISQELRGEFIQPETEVEIVLARIWSEILGIEQIGIYDNFFELGGHSLRATTLVGKIYKELNLEVPLREIFKTSTLKEMSKYIQRFTKISYKAIEKIEEREFYPASSAQKRMYMLQQFDLDSTGYNMPGVLEIEGRLDVEKVEQTFLALIKRHETLRTSFETIDEQIVQKIDHDVEFKIEYIAKLTDQPETIIQDFVRPFELNRAPLLRVAVLRLEESKHLLIFDMHHIISDGISIGILIHEFANIYEGKILAEPIIQYKDYAEWLNNQSKATMLKKQEEYWSHRFSGDVPVLNLPTDDPRPTMQSFEGDHIGFTLDQEFTKGLKRVAEETGSTLYMVLLAGLNILLSRYSGQDDIVIGSPIAGRPHPDLEKIIGIFVNTLAMRNNPVGNMIYEDFLKEVKENALMAYENQDYQFEDLVDKLNVRRDLSRNPLFDVMFTMQNMDSGELNLTNLTIKPYQYENRTAKFDLTVSAQEIDGVIGLDFEYSSRLFKRETLERMVIHFNNILKEVVANPKIKLDELEILTVEEKNQIIEVFNDTDADYPGNKTIHGLFEEQVKKVPDHIAALYGDHQLTYRDLNEKANRLARSLRDKGVKSESIVGILAERSLEMIIGIFGILKAGGAYLPIDPKYPQDRIQFMLEDSNAQIILTKDQWIGQVEFAGELIHLDDETVYDSDDSNLVLMTSPTDLAYIIYTSGSTGKPKGVMIEHHSVINRLNWMQWKYPISEQDTILQKTPFTFDVSVWELFWWSFQGAKVSFLAPEGEKDPEVIVKAIEKDQVTTMHFVPSMLNIFLEYLKNYPGLEGLSSLRQVFASGEALTVKQVEQFNSLLNKANGTLLHNLYGPTEATVDVTYFDCLPDKECKVIPIGKPIDNTQIYILDQANHLQPIGVPGELCIAGVNLARGYLNRPELTQEKFINLSSGERIYKTGDLASWMPDGNINYLGRIDHQVKLRGFRIELGEIESRLLNHPDIKETVVIDRKDKNDDPYLCAYMVSDQQITNDELREHLLKHLPENMIPQHFVQIDKIPTNSNGKADRKALPEPDFSQRRVTEYQAPGNEIEEKLVMIWSDLLGIEKIGIKDSFFTLGGHSIKASLLVSKIQKEMNVQVPLREVFTRPTIKELAQYIQNAADSSFTSIEPLQEMEYYLLSSAQRRVYLMWQLNQNSISYNMPVAMTLTGQLDQSNFEKAISGLVKRHEVFRSSFVMVDGELQQRVLKDIELNITYLEGEEENLKEMIDQLILPFDLSKPPLFRVNLIKFGDYRYLLLFDLHHIISDGVSMMILTRDFINLYEGRKLPSLRFQYKDYAAWHHSLMGTNLMKKMSEYWVNQLNNFTYTELPGGNLISNNNTTGRIKSVELDEILIKRMDDFCQKHNITKFTFVFAVFKVILAKALNQNDNTIGIPVAGRNNEAVENMIGLFLNVLAIRTILDRDLTFKEYLYDLRDTVIEAQEYQDYPYEELYAKIKEESDFPHHSLFSILFNYLPVQNEEMKLKGLTVKPYNLGEVESKYDLTLYVNERKDKLILTAVYKDNLEEKMIEKILNSFTIVMDAVLNCESTTVSQISLSREDQTQQFAQDLEFDFDDNDDFF